jgi:hypothetical protein
MEWWRLVFATWHFGGERGTSSQPHAYLIETQCHGLDITTKGTVALAVTAPGW